MAAANKVKDKDRGWKALGDRLERSKHLHVMVGVQGKAAERKVDGSITLVRLAGVHEFGATIKTRGDRFVIHGDGEARLVDRDFIGPVHGNVGERTIVIPERSFIRSTMIEKSSSYVDFVKRLALLIVDGKLEPDKAIRLLGEKVKADIQNKITSGIAPPNAESTIAKKGSSKPLIDHGTLLGAISYVVIDESEEGMKQAAATATEKANRMALNKLGRELRSSHRRRVKRAAKAKAKAGK